MDLAHLRVVDNHAHSLSRKCMEQDLHGFRGAFSESSSKSFLEIHFPDSISYRGMLRSLGRIVEFDSESDLLAKRCTLPSADYIRQLWSTVSLRAMMIDDGYESKSSFSLRELADLCAIPLYRVVRIESVLEQELAVADSFEQLETRFTRGLLSNLSDRIYALKTIAAYRGGLNLSPAEKHEAELEFDNIRKERQSRNSAADSRISVRSHSIRIERSALYSYFLFKAFELAADHDLPVQVHTGFGDSDLQLDQANPALLTSLFRSKRLARARFVLLHCYPYVKEASYLCSIFPQVYMDLSLTTALAASRAESIMSEALALAPPGKLLLGSDGHTVPEMHWWGVQTFKKSLARVLQKLVEDDFLSDNEAMHYARRICSENAIELYDLEELR